MTTSQETMISHLDGLIVDNIRDYSTLIANKDALIKFLTCAIENDNFDFIAENNIQEALERAFNAHCLFCDDIGCKFMHQPFDAERDCGVRAQGEI